MERLKKKIVRFVKANRVEVIFLTLILLVSAFLRFYRLPEYMTFLGDEGRDALVWLRMVRKGKFVLIGPVTSIGNMYLGPLYYYFALPWFLLFGLSPVGPSAMVAFLGVVTVGFIWWVGREWFDKRVGLIAAFLYAISPVVIVYSRSSWNPNVMPFFALLTIYGIYQFWIKQRYWWIPIVGIALSFALQSHYLGLLLIPTVSIFWLLAFKDVFRKKSKFKLLIRYTIYCVLIFSILTVAPLVWFDLRHGFINYKAFKTFFTVRQTTVNLKIYKAIPNLWDLISQVSTRLIAGKNETYGVWLALLTILGLIGFSAERYYKKPNWKKIWQENRELILILAWLTISLFGLGNYKQHIYDHYFGFFFPAPFLLVGWVLSQAWEKKIYGKIIVILALCFLVFLSFQKCPLKNKPNNQLGRTQKIARFIIEEAKGKPFNLGLIAERNYPAAYAYFMERWEIPPTDIEPLRAEETITDQLFVICEKLPCQPTTAPAAEIANFGWSKIDKKWEIEGIEVYRLIHTK